MIRRPPRSTHRVTLFPYTTLFRSVIVYLAIGNAVLTCGSNRAKRSDRVRLVAITTSTLMKREAVDGFAGFNHQSGKVVTVRTVLIAIAALTSMRYVPCLCAGGSNYLCGEAVTRCRNRSILIDITTHAGVQGVAVFSACRCNHIGLENMRMVTGLKLHENLFFVIKPFNKHNDVCSKPT